MTAAYTRPQPTQEVAATGQPPELADGWYSVDLAASGKQLIVGPAQSLLDVVLKAGVEAPFSCREGMCGMCETRVISGHVEHVDLVLSPRERAANATMMICVSYCKRGHLVLDL